MVFVNSHRRMSGLDGQAVCYCTLACMSAAKYSCCQSDQSWGAPCRHASSFSFCVELAEQVASVVSNLLIASAGVGEVAHASYGHCVRGLSFRGQRQLLR